MFFETLKRLWRNGWCAWLRIGRFQIWLLWGLAGPKVKINGWGVWNFDFHRLFLSTRRLVDIRAMVFQVYDSSCLLSSTEILTENWIALLQFRDCILNELDISALYCCLIQLGGTFGSWKVPKIWDWDL